MKPEFIIIGISDAPEPHFAAEALERICKGKVFSGGKRHHEIVRRWLPESAVWIDITAPLDAVFEQYQQYFEQANADATTNNESAIVVFASGDPLFFGFANTIRRKMPNATITLYPYFNSLQMLAHRLVLPYHDMKIVSLTGRPWHEFDAALIGDEKKIGVLTDGNHTPAAIAQRMNDYGFDDYTMAVGERLGNPEEERIHRLTLKEASEREFAMPNCVILQKEERQETSKDNRQATAHGTASTHRFLGIPDLLFDLLDGREKMITKAPIRLLTLASLELQNRHSFWDIGFCTGSVSIEAKLQFPHLHITAFEIREEGKSLMDTNSRRFHAPGIDTVIGNFLEADTSQYAQPDAVFIGGHGGKLEEIVRKAAETMTSGGILVYNCVAPSSVTDARIRTDSRERFEKTAMQCGMTIEEPLHVAINDYHPIDILKARKP